MQRSERAFLRIVSLPAMLAAWWLSPTGSWATDSLPTGTFVEGIACVSDSTQTYSLYLPTSYSTERTCPALLVFDPRGRSVFAAERFRRAAETFGWILVSSDGTRSDGPWEPNRRAMEALWPEVHTRYAVDPNRLYAAGFSGGAIVAWYLAQFATPPLAGVIACGGRMAQEIPLEPVRFAHFGAAGDADFNFMEMKGLDRVVSQRGSPHQFRHFPGRHQWLPRQLAFESIQWMEIVAMQRQLRPRDAGLVESAFASAVVAAESLESANQNLEAWRRYATIVATWNGLRDVSAIRLRMETLERHPVTREQMHQEHGAERFETDHLARLSRLLGDDRSLTGSSHEELRQELQVPALLAQAREESATAAPARRVLEWIFTRASFYMARDRLQQQRLAEARLLLQIALDIHPQAAWVWYELARVEAQAGTLEPALHALHRAIDEGFADLHRLGSDPSFASLRTSSAYAAAVARLRASIPASPDSHGP